MKRYRFLRPLTAIFVPCVEVYGFEAEAKINREEFGLTWNAALETGGVLVGKDIKIKVELEVNPAA
jgi:polyisoprenoid-binding protein YceI